MEINKGKLHFFMPAPELKEFEDEIHSITEINEGLNLFDGDIVESNSRSSILREDTRWASSVPYLLGDTLDLHSKGIILRAFEQFGLKSCINFTPWQNEDYFIKLQKFGGCYSNVGKVSPGGQTVSIGHGCAVVHIVEHELLHALGFHHEQSRYDRDDHVTIIWENVKEGFEHNFNKVSEDSSSLLSTSYDYTSVMHYSADALTNGNGFTIITKQPEFQDVIGKSIEMSSTDTLELNRLYHCKASVSFLDHCSFDDDSMCGMSVCSKSSVRWERVRRADGGPRSDRTYLGTSSKGNDFFMHFSTMTGEKGDSARLSTRRMTPGRSCQVQCLQFYYYYSGSKTDLLNIYIREFDSAEDAEGTHRLMGQITGSPADNWQLHHVPLNASKTFQVEFEAYKGTGESIGGFSVDDINLSETECPHETWQISNFEEFLNNNQTFLFSPRYYSTDSYGFQIILVRSPRAISLFIRLVSGDYDDKLEWPLAWRQITFLMLDQNPHMQLRMSQQRSLTTDPTVMNNNGDFYWGNPREVGSLFEEGGETFFASNLYGIRIFMTMEDLRKRDFLKGGDAIFSFTMQDLRPLLTINSLPCARIPQQNFTAVPGESADDGACSGVTSTTIATPTTTTPSSCVSILCSFSPKMVCSPLILLITLYLLLND
ncbi:meprin A subunit beta-like isoform X1 [Alosa sapidissima]|uniref:meprin A subunit beta-like isoform X1 n=1 Tax=Alosa sapidissima TaxID=34773 RepID=UPI001C0A3050|nr:meprin A subunit beta-like isoform X1 [Alosa sapidissima]